MLGPNKVAILLKMRDSRRIRRRNVCSPFEFCDRVPMLCLRWGRLEGVWPCYIDAKVKLSHICLILRLIQSAVNARYKFGKNFYRMLFIERKEILCKPQRQPVVSMELRCPFPLIFNALGSFSTTQTSSSPVTFT